MGAGAIIRRAFALVIMGHRRNVSKCLNGVIHDGPASCFAFEAGLVFNSYNEVQPVFLVLWPENTKTGSTGLREIDGPVECLGNRGVRLEDLPVTLFH